MSTYETAAELKCGCGNCPDMLDGLAGSDCCRVLRRWKEEYANGRLKILFFLENNVCFILDGVCVCELPSLKKLIDKVSLPPLPFYINNQIFIKDILELCLFCYYDTVVMDYASPPENK